MLFIMLKNKNRIKKKICGQKILLQWIILLKTLRQKNFASEKDGREERDPKFV